MTAVVCTGVRWGAGGAAVLGGRRARPQEHAAADPGPREPALPLAPGCVLALRTTGPRRCLGVQRAGRHTPCPGERAVPAHLTRAQCEECARVDRAHSVAADTAPADPRTYRVYLAWFGPGMVKSGITAAERERLRLLEQGAVAFTWLGQGPLMAARRTEELLRSALGVPDRVPYADKRAARSRLPSAAERAAELTALHTAAAALLPGGAEALDWLPAKVVDQAEDFGLAGLPPANALLTGLVPGAALGGTLLAVAGPDLYLRQSDGRVLIADGRLLAGWPFTASAAPGGARTDAVTDAPVRELPAEQPALF
ncbi:DUF2797 domain-containing protein [Streptomyces sp. NPDC050560]|uniref:DUF2797 domain-containing protein n=1 Tax=Streptomyces sp. NPDC050560 TaxID=3365630 RepID=UPI0037A56603